MTFASFDFELFALLAPTRLLNKALYMHTVNNVQYNCINIESSLSPSPPPPTPPSLILNINVSQF